MRSYIHSCLLRSLPCPPRLCEKFTVHSQPEKARALEVLTRRFLGLDLEKSYPKVRFLLPSNAPSNAPPNYLPSPWVGLHILIASPPPSSAPPGPSRMPTMVPFYSSSASHPPPSTLTISLHSNHLECQRVTIETRVGTMPPVIACPTPCEPGGGGGAIHGLISLRPLILDEGDAFDWATYLMQGIEYPSYSDSESEVL